MKRPLTVLLVAATLLSGCGFRDSGLNPLNWFGRSRSEPVATGEATNPLIPRRRAFARPDYVYPGNAIAVVREISVERIPGGAIVHATGVSERQGPYNARLTVNEANADPSVVVYDFEVVTPTRARATGPEATRLVTVAAYITEKDLEGVRTIRVSGARNAQVSSRR